MKAAAAVAVSAAFALAAVGASEGARTFKVAYVTDVAATATPHDLRGAALLGFQRSVRRFRVEGRVVQFNPRAGAASTLAYLARQRYDLIIIGEVRSFLDLDAVSAVARRFPRTKFVVTDPPVLQPWPENVQGSIWRVEQPAYLAGYLAGLIERRRLGRHVVGSVGGYPIVSVDTFIAGFEAGARSADPGIRVLRRYTSNFFNAAKCRAVASSEIAAGARVLFNVAGACGLGTLEAAKQNGVWAIGVDVDQSFLGPHVLTSVVKRFDVQIYDTVRALVLGSLRTGGNAVWDVHDGAVGLGKISPKVPRSIVAEVDRVRAKIASGEIQVPARLGSSSGP